MFQEEFLRERSKHYGGDVVWLRPKDIVRPDIPILVSNKNEGFEIRQGKIFVIDFCTNAVISNKLTVNSKITNK